MEAIMALTRIEIEHRLHSLTEEVNQGEGGGGATTFDALTDTPSDKLDKEGCYLLVGDANDIVYTNTGVIVTATDPTTLSEGRYYVQEKFTNSPALTGVNNYVGMLEVLKGFDGQNGAVIVYYSGEGVYHKFKLAGGWKSTWVSSK